jgi:hypothetical protein
MKANLESLLLRQSQLTAQIHDIQSREKAKNRKADTRAKILIGALLIGRAKKGSQNHIAQIRELTSDVTSQRDKQFLSQWLSTKFNS